VNIAARLETLTKQFPDYPILINETTAQALRNYPEVVLHSLGPQRLKGRHEPVEVYAPMRAESVVGSGSARSIDLASDLAVDRQQHRQSATS
jgi:class 3 adenylate cyclase